MTEFYGNPEEKRMAHVFSSKIGNDSTALGFIKSKDLLLEYAVKRYYEGEVSTNYGLCHPCEHPLTEMTRTYKYMMDEVVYQGKIYYVGEVEGEYCIWTEMPKIIDDKTFKWKLNTKYNSREATIASGNFEYFCIVKEGGDAVIEIKYTKCENKHRNKVTLGRIDVYYASNEDILKAIEMWREEFRKDV